METLTTLYTDTWPPPLSSLAEAVRRLETRVLNQSAPAPSAPNPTADTSPMSYYPVSPPHYPMTQVAKNEMRERLETRCRNLRLGEPQLGVNVSVNDGVSHTVRAILSIRLDATTELSLKSIGGSEPTAALTAAVRDQMYGQLCERALKFLAQ